MANINGFISTVKAWGDVGYSFSKKDPRRGMLIMAKVKLLPETLPDYYPNHFITFAHLEALQNRFPKVVEMSLIDVDTEGFNKYVKAMQENVKTATKYCICIDSMKPGMTYQNLATLYGISISEVITILKMTRPEPI